MNKWLKYGLILLAGGAVIAVVVKLNPKLDAKAAEAAAKLKSAVA